MYRRALTSLIGCCLALTVSAQTPSVPSTPPTSAPAVTAENESWYQRGEAITYEGNFYIPAGPTVHFNRNEMVRTGFYRGIPLYARTTIEPFSVIYVRVGGGLVQPYERPRFGEIAGTVGSLGSAFPVPNADTRRVLTDAPQAPSAPTMLPETLAERSVGVDATGTPPVGPQPIGTSGIGAAAPAPPIASTPTTAAQETRPVGTTGRVVVLPRPRPLVTALRPTGANGVYVEFDNARWFSSGSAVPFDSSAFQRIGDHHGFPVYVRVGGDASTIYIPTASTVQSLVAPYSRR